jgi:aspartate-semialdehyde dehydrogenase
MKVAVLGATGLVGSTILKVLEERNIPGLQVYLVASERSVGKAFQFKGRDQTLISIEEALALKPAAVLCSAGSAVSLEWANSFVANGAWFIDNSSAFRMAEESPLIVPEINSDTLPSKPGILPVANCSTIQLVMALKPISDAFGLKRVVVSTYQSVTGSGQKGVDQLESEERGQLVKQPIYPHPIYKNVIPHIDVFLPNGYTKEEQKIIKESRKILNLPTLAITATAVRVPAIGGHSISANIEFNRPFELENIAQLLATFPGIRVQDDPATNFYPMPTLSHNQDQVYIGRIRRDNSQPNTANLWIVADNLRKGAATNAVQILELLILKNLVH